MSSTPDMFGLDFLQLQASVLREVRMRERVYPGLVEREKMTQEQREHEEACMRQVWLALSKLPEIKRKLELIMANSGGTAQAAAETAHEAHTLLREHFLMGGW